MSINPVQGVIPPLEPRSDEANRRLAQTRPSAPQERSSEAGSEAPSKHEARRPQPAPVEVQQDEVRVQRDQTNGEIVIRYMDRFGNVILQIPSSQVLGLTRAIDEDFQQEAKARENTVAQPGIEGGKTHGD